MANTTANRRTLLTSLILTLVVSFCSFFATMALNWGPKLGLDLAGGLSVVFRPATPASVADMQEVTSVLTNRVNGLGVSGATVNLQGKNVVVSVPGVKDARDVLASIGQTAQLLFRPVLCQALLNKPVKLPPNYPVPACGAAYLMTQANLGVTPNVNSVSGFNMNNVSPDPNLTSFPTTLPAYDDPTKSVLLPSLGTIGQRYVLGPSQMTGQSVKSAVAQQDQAGAWVVNYSLTGAGSSKWDQVAASNFHQLVAIELDGVVQSAPVISATDVTPKSFGGSGSISGSFTETSAKNLAMAMRFGSLPVRLVPLTTQSVSPTLGHSSLVAGLGAGLVGLILVLLYTVIYYRALGLVILLGLTVTAALLWAIISALAHTAFAPSFDLAGVTGLIVSIGITVDSYIVYFERLKDETRAGRTMRTSVDRGFKSAWRTVLAADLVSLLAAVLLYLIATGSVRGFAFFLGLSTLMDVGITWYFTRPLVILLGRRGGEQSHSALSIAAGMGAGSGQ